MLICLLTGMDGIKFEFISFLHLLILFFYISQIVDSVAKGCPLLEYIDLFVDVREEDPLYPELTPLSSLRHLRSAFIHVNFKWYGMPSANREDFRLSLDAIVEQGLLEVSMTTISYSYIKKVFLRKLVFFT